MSKETKQQKKIRDDKIVTYWANAIKRAGKKMPTEYWDAAKNRLCAKTESTDRAEDTRPVVNSFRNHYESNRSYLDQKDPSFKVRPAVAFSSDEATIKRAECEKVYLERVWVEQECQVAESQKLDSSLINNVGYTMPIFDRKKWMPSVRYLPAKDVRFDPDCKGIWERASWCAYRDDKSIEALKGEFPNLTKADIALIQKDSGSILSEEALEEVKEEDKPMYSAITVWYIFARNDAAIRKYGEEEKTDELSDQRMAEELQLTTKQRKIVIIDGLKRPVENKDSWPFNLDHNELPITQLVMNKVPEDYFGFTDFQQMERMDELSDKVMSYVETDAYYAANRKYLMSKSAGQPSKESIENFINSNKTSVLTDMLDENGDPLLKEVAVRAVNNALPGFYTLMEEAADKASGQAELTTKSMADFKDVTAMGVRFQEQKLHQRVNLRLGGPRGYEKSIQQDAVKMLEIAHQYVPKLSSVGVIRPVGAIDPETNLTYDEETEVREILPWKDAMSALRNGGQLHELGIDAIVGEELAKYWVSANDVPIEEIRLSTEVVVLPGSTRSITQEQQAADLLDMYINNLWPTIYQPMGRFDLAIRFLEHVGQLKGIDRIEDFLPKEKEIQQFRQEQQQLQEAQAQEGQQAEQQQMAIAAQDAEQKETSADLALEREEVRAQMKMEEELQKAELEQAKSEMQMNISRQKVASQEPANANV